MQKKVVFFINGIELVFQRPALCSWVLINFSCFFFHLTVCEIATSDEKEVYFGLFLYIRMFFTFVLSHVITDSSLACNASRSFLNFYFFLSSIVQITKYHSDPISVTTTTIFLCNIKMSQTIPYFHVICSISRSFLLV